MLENLLNLEAKRKAAGISQGDMANFLAVSQSQISRYEQDPENAPAGIIMKWNQYCGDMAGSAGLEIEDPRLEINGRIELIKNYIETEPQFDNELPDERPVNSKSIMSGILATSKKPRLGVFGKFDAGKSRLINILLGGDKLPTSYQPATNIICLIRHMKDKPSWQMEDVWIMGKGFNLDWANDQLHSKQHKLYAGGYEALRQHGIHNHSATPEEIENKKHHYAAVVYVESPILQAVDIIDSPGYDNNSDDQDRAETARKLIDILIYASQATGFMDSNDLSYVSTILRNVPVLKTDEAGSLSNVFFVGTHAHHVTKKEIEENIFNAASARSFRHLENVLIERSSSSDRKISPSDLRNRFFSFSADDTEIRSEFEKELKGLITETLPQSTIIELQKYLLSAKESSKAACQSWINRLIATINEREKAQKEVEFIEDQEDSRLRKKTVHERKIIGMIKSFSSESNLFINKVFSEQTTFVAIETMIKNRYSDKKEAQGLAASYLIDSLQKTINDFIVVKSNALGEEIDLFLEGYGPEINPDSLSEDGFDFNAKAAFMGALSGLGTIGALAAWASIAAAGSNLGAYILIGQIVGWLSSIGIGLGGAGSVMAFVSSIGGPVTLAIAAAFAVGLAIFGLFGDSWQTKLAKKIYEGLTEHKVQEKFSESVNKYWRDTEEAFIEAMIRTEAHYQEKIKSLRTLAFDVEPTKIEAELEFAKELYDFFAGIPWRTIRQ